MERWITSSLVFAVAALGSVALATADAERTCLTPGGPGLLEGWSSIPQGGIVLDLANGIAVDAPVPGFPRKSILESFCGIQGSGFPVWQSIAAAANELTTPIMPGSSGPGGASSFAINPTPTNFGIYANWLTWDQGSNHATLLWNAGGAFGGNQITFWEHPAIWAMFGTTPIAGAFVRVSPGTANIVECDIAMNAMTESAANGNRPLWTFVEDNAALGQTFASKSYTTYFNQTTAFQDPVFGYVDIQGVLVHELGHLAGLAHSLVDGPTSPTSSRMPTMYARAQTQPYARTITIGMSTCNSFQTVSANGSNTLFGGIVGAPARTLEADDVAALSVAYPGADQPTLGSITGSVFDTAGIVQGAHVVAVSATNPEQVRVGVLTYDAGTYTIGSLPPGPYYVFVEPPDLAGYFAGTSPPEYVDPLANCGSPPDFTAEFWDSSENFTETLPEAASVINVSAGLTSGPFDVLVAGPGGNPLTATACTTPAGQVCDPFSIRGAVHDNLGGPGAQIGLRYTGGTPGDAVFLVFSLDRQYVPIFGQVIETSLAPPTHLAVIPGVISPAGTFELFLSVNPSHAQFSLFTKAVLFPQNGSLPAMSNTTTVWLER